MCLSDNNCFYLFISIKKNACQCYVVTINYKRNRKRTNSPPFFGLPFCHFLFGGISVTSVNRWKKPPIAMEAVSRGERGVRRTTRE